MRRRVERLPGGCGRRRCPPMTPRRGRTWPGAWSGPRTVSAPACQLRCAGFHRGAVRHRQMRPDWYGLPDCTRRGQSSTPSGNPAAATIRAVGLDALDADGRWPGKRWRRTFGQKKGAAFVVGAAGGEPLMIVEGEADALASVWLLSRRGSVGGGRRRCPGPGPGHPRYRGAAL